MKPEEFDNLEQKLEYLEENDITFRAGYRGLGEVFTAVFKDGMFLDFHWMDGQKTQYFKPTEFVRVVDEILEFTHENGFMAEELEGYPDSE